MTRPDARRAIVDAANHIRRRRDRGVTPLAMRHLQQAVCIVRHNRAVKPDVLVAAGFNPERRR